MKKSILSCLFLLVCFSAWAHVVPYELEEHTTGRLFWEYLVLGFEHILPLGLDHILFIFCIFFLNTNLRSIVLQASMFTLAHSLTLGLAAYGIISPPAHIVEPLIALSILLLALENVFSQRIQPWRIVMVFVFGLVHGMGFAGVLAELGIPREAFLTSLLAFNLGVELGQITIILAMYFLVARSFSARSWYRRWVVVPTCLAIAVVAAYWTIERIGWV